MSNCDQNSKTTSIEQNDNCSENLDTKTGCLEDQIINTTLTDKTTKSPLQMDNNITNDEDYENDEDDDEESSKYIKLESHDDWEKRNFMIELSPDHPVDESVDRAYLAIDNNSGVEYTWYEIDLNANDRWPKNNEDFKMLVHRLEMLCNIDHHRIVNFKAFWIDYQLDDVHYYDKDIWKNFDENELFYETIEKIEQENINEDGSVKKIKYRLVFVTELMNNGTLEDFLSGDQTNLPSDTINKWLVQILEALDHLHNQTPRLFHKNLSCSTIYRQNNGQLKVGGIWLDTVNRFIHQNNNSYGYYNQTKQITEKQSSKTTDLIELGSSKSVEIQDSINTTPIISTTLFNENEIDPKNEIILKREENVTSRSNSIIEMEIGANERIKAKDSKTSNKKVGARSKKDHFPKDLTVEESKMMKCDIFAYGICILIVLYPDILTEAISNDYDIRKQMSKLAFRKDVLNRLNEKNNKNTSKNNNNISKGSIKNYKNIVKVCCGQSPKSTSLLLRESQFINSKHYTLKVLAGMCLLNDVMSQLDDGGNEYLRNLGKPNNDTIILTYKKFKSPKSNEIVVENFKVSDMEIAYKNHELNEAKQKSSKKKSKQRKLIMPDLNLEKFIEDLRSGKFNLTMSFLNTMVKEDEKSDNGTPLTNIQELPENESDAIIPRLGTKSPTTISQVCDDDGLDSISNTNISKLDSDNDMTITFADSSSTNNLAKSNWGSEVGKVQYLVDRISEVSLDLNLLNPLYTYFDNFDNLKDSIYKITDHKQFIETRMKIDEILAESEKSSNVHNDFVHTGIPNSISNTTIGTSISDNFSNLSNVGTCVEEDRNLNIDSVNQNVEILGHQSSTTTVVSNAFSDHVEILEDEKCSHEALAKLYNHHSKINNYKEMDSYPLLIEMNLQLKYENGVCGSLAFTATLDEKPSDIINEMFENGFINVNDQQKVESTYIKGRKQLIDKINHITGSLIEEDEFKMRHDQLIRFLQVCN